MEVKTGSYGINSTDLEGIRIFVSLRFNQDFQIDRIFSILFLYLSCFSVQRPNATSDEATKIIISDTINFYFRAESIKYQ